MRSPDPKPSNEFRPLPCVFEGTLAIEARSVRAFPRHWHDEFGIGLILAGAHASASGRGEVEAGAGAIITVNPGEVHDGRPIGGARVWRMLYIKPELVTAVQENFAPESLADSEFTAPVYDRPDLRNLFLTLYCAATEKTGDTGKMAFDIALGEAALVLCAARKPSLRASAAIMTAKEYLHDRQDGPVTLSDLASACDLSPFHLNRAFRATFGIPPHTYLLQLRVARARRLIEEGKTLSASAAEAGFADQSHMTRIFTRQFGYSPSALVRAKRKIVQDQ